MELFSKEENSKKSTVEPLASRLRPASLKDFFGQDHILKDKALLKEIIEKKLLQNLILWGPPGSGKTTLANIIANSMGCEFFSLSAVMAGVKDIRETISKAKKNLAMNRNTVLFIDEIHRFNKSQQDALLHDVEEGVITLIGATTENPSFEVNNALLSRVKVIRLESLNEDEIEKIILHAIKEDDFLKEKNLTLEHDALTLLKEQSMGDARIALNTLETAYMLEDKVITRETILKALQRKNIYDKKGDEHYNIISAFIKSMRGSDVDASLYYLSRMIEGGEDPLFIVRRMVVFASEDIGNADPKAITLAMSIKEAVEFVGLPEARISLFQGVVYLASAPKSNASYMAGNKAMEDVMKKGALDVPLHIRNAPTNLMKEMGYGKNYKYPHNFDENYVDEKYLPKELQNKKYYEPSEHGYEKYIKERLEYLKNKKGGKK